MLSSKCCKVLGRQFYNATISVEKTNFDFVQNKNDLFNTNYFLVIPNANFVPLNESIKTVISSSHSKQNLHHFIHKMVCT